MPGGVKDEIQCLEAGFQSPLDLIPNPSELEDYSQVELDLILQEAIADTSRWREYNALFDTEVS